MKNVSFEVRRGEVVGVIGRNGAGKSTLLKILSRVTEPTEGWVDIYGRVGSLLEVGTGFHPELTGRENVYLNGAILGMRRAEIVRKFDDIIAFAEVEQFVDTPVKHYSSGMYMRLAFAVAAHLDPEILIVDEVLAVGDATFQKRCLGKMGEIAKEGRTVLFVSHNMPAVQSLCSRAVWLQRGQLVGDAPPHEVIRQYIGRGNSALIERTWKPGEVSPDHEVQLLAARVTGEDESLAAWITTADPFRIEFEYRVLEGGLKLNLSMVVHNQDEVCVFATPSIEDGGYSGRPFLPGLYRSTCHIPGDLLNDGVHRVDILFVKDTTTVLFRVDEALAFEIHDGGKDRGDWYGKWVGAVRPRLAWRSEPLANLRT
jgi:lipopolysaccharide transport system ATP-binding protein